MPHLAEGKPHLGAGAPVITAAHREVQGLLLLQRQGRKIRVGNMVIICI